MWGDATRRIVVGNGGHDRPYALQILQGWWLMTFDDLGGVMEVEVLHDVTG